MIFYWMRLMKTSLTKTETEWNGIKHFDLGAADINSGSVSTNTQLFSISTVFAPHTIFITRYATIQELSSLYRGENAKSNQICSLSLIQIFFDARIQCTEGNIQKVNYQRSKGTLWMSNKRHHFIIHFYPRPMRTARCVCVFGCSVALRSWLGIIVFIIHLDDKL